MGTSDPHAQIAPTDLNADLNIFRQLWQRSLNAEAAHAVFLLIWKRIDTLEQGPSQQSVMPWCNLALNMMLENAGERNVGKVQRKLVVQHMNLPDLQAANDVLSKMSEQIKQHPLSLYLAYSVALRCRDDVSGILLFSDGL